MTSMSGRTIILVGYNVRGSTWSVPSPCLISLGLGGSYGNHAQRELLQYKVEFLAIGLAMGLSHLVCNCDKLLKLLSLQVSEIGVERYIRYVVSLCIFPIPQKKLACWIDSRIGSSTWQLQ